MVPGIVNCAHTGDDVNYHIDPCLRSCFSVVATLILTKIEDYYVMNRTLLVDDEMLDRIIINELKEVYRLNCLPNKIDCSDDYIDPDSELLYSVDRVLQYFMARDEYDRWVAIKDNENTTQ